MSEKNKLTLLAKAVGITVVTGLASLPIANASDNPFGMTDLGSGYKIAAAEEGKCGEGKCGGDKAEKSKKDGECGEGKCGGDKAEKEGECGGDKVEKEGECGGNG